MRGARIKARDGGFYHVVSRIGGRRFLIDETEKGILLSLVRRAAAFSGVEVFTYALMDNHFHLLVRVPPRRDVDAAELRRRVIALYGSASAAALFEKWDLWRRKGLATQVEEAQARLRARMFDLSQFCKTFKEVYTRDYNRRHDNTGTIWEGRFKSILLEGSEGALMSVAAYIHLNPVRAGIAGDASSARHTAYGAACQGDASAQAGLAALAAQVFGTDPGDWKSARTACENAMDGRIAAVSGQEPPDDGGTTTLQAVAPGLPAAASPALSPALPAVLSPSLSAASPAPAAPPADVRRLFGMRRAAFLHGGALGSAEFLSEVSTLLPPRLKRRPRGVFDGCTGLGLSSALGVREA